MLLLLLVAASVKSDDRVRFPGLNYDDPPARPRSSGIEPCYRNESFCEFISDYPHSVDVDTNLLQNILIKAKIFDTQKTSRRKSNFERFGSFSSDEKVRACQVVRRTVFPTKARNIRGEYVYIVNDARYTQSVEIEQCVSEGSSCLTDHDAPFSGNTVCRQKYSTHKLYAISGH